MKPMLLHYSPLKPLLLLFFTIQLTAIKITAQSRNNSITKDLLQAIRMGDDAMLEKLVNEGADVNDSLNGYTPLMAAALSGTAKQMQLLIKKGANVNYVSSNELSALWLAAHDLDKLTLLLENAVDVNQFVRGYSILVKLSSMQGISKNIQLLIDKGSDPKKSAVDNTLLYMAASSGDTATLHLLIKAGLNANDTINGGDYPINAAIFYRNPLAAKMLIDNGADVNSASRSFGLEAFNGFTPLMFAAMNNDKGSFYYLLEHGANPNARNKNGHTALMLLQQAEEDDPAMTKALLDHGADPSIKNPAGNDALHFALQKGNTQSVAMLKKLAVKK